MTSFKLTRPTPVRERALFFRNEHVKADQFYADARDMGLNPVFIVEINREDKAHGRIPARVEGFAVVYDAQTEKEES